MRVFAAAALAVTFSFATVSGAIACPMNSAKNLEKQEVATVLPAGPQTKPVVLPTPEGKSSDKS